MGWNSLRILTGKGISNTQISVKSSEKLTESITSRHLFKGLPVIKDDLCKDYKILSNDGYIVGFCNLRNIALWSFIECLKLTLSVATRKASYKR